MEAVGRVVTMRLSSKAFCELIGPSEMGRLKEMLAQRQRETGIATT